MTSLFDPGLDLFPRGIDVEAPAYFPKFLQRLAASRDLFRRKRSIDRRLRLDKLRHWRAVARDDDLAASFDLSDESRKLLFSLEDGDVFHEAHSNDIDAGRPESRLRAEADSADRGHSAGETTFVGVSFRRTHTNSGQANAAMVLAAWGDPARLAFM